jgi:hypothetical protein
VSRDERGYHIVEEGLGWVVGVVWRGAVHCCDGWSGKEGKDVISRRAKLAQGKGAMGSSGFWRREREPDIPKDEEFPRGPPSNFRVKMEVVEFTCPDLSTEVQKVM